MARGLVIAAPQSGSGKTLVTLAVIRALRDAGFKVASCKVGPDYIDPRFHERASGSTCFNLDLWAMGREMCAGLLSAAAEGQDFVIVEGVMGLFDGPQDGVGSTADLAAALGLPVLLVVDASHQAQSVGALLHGFHGFAPPGLAGVIFNRVKSARHRAILEESARKSGAFACGFVTQNNAIHLPSRHLGLVQAEEIQGLDEIIAVAAADVSREKNVLELVQGQASEIAANPWKTPLPAPAQHIEIARDIAFNFIYPHILEGWKRQNSSVTFFSPLANEGPTDPQSFVFLPGGYPELHAAQISSNSNFLNTLCEHKGEVYGECGGFMVLGKTLMDSDGVSHKMAGLLPVETSFAKRQLHLGYRSLSPNAAPWSKPLRGHEFHYSTLAHQGAGEALFKGHGLRVKNVSGSYAHIISEAP